MDKVRVEIVAVEESHDRGDAYALWLKETDGDRRLQIVIGAPEAQAIVTELQHVRMQRPMTHDLLRNIIDGLGAHVREVMITELQQATFFAKIVFEYSELEIDARPSDAIALAVRLDCPIYVADDLMSGPAASSAVDDAAEAEEEEETEEAEEADEIEQIRASATEPEEDVRVLSEEERLRRALAKAIEIENYEMAASLRDQLNRLQASGD
jgi:hypothetical protein